MGATNPEDTTTTQITQDAGQTDGGTGDDKQTAVTAPADFDAWLTAQPDETKTLVADLHEKKVAGLKSALSSERDERKAERQKLQGQLSEAIAKATGAEKAALESLQGDIATTGARADFFADAHEAGVLDLRTAWAAVREYDLHDRKGNPDLEALKVKCPYLFQQARPAVHVNAGSGTQTKPSQAEVDPLRAAVARSRGQL
jgi:hypothetical protein